MSCHVHPRSFKIMQDHARHLVSVLNLVAFSDSLDKPNSCSKVNSRASLPHNILIESHTHIMGKNVSSWISQTISAVLEINYTKQSNHGMYLKLKLGRRHDPVS